MNQIHIEGIQLYAYHGCLPQEGEIGSPYLVDVSLFTDFRQASITDNLIQTIDYVDVFNIVKTEMAIRSNLLEHVGKRIIDALKKQVQGIDRIILKVTKINPPMNGNVQKVSIVMEE